MGNKYLALYLDAPLQSWGYTSRYDRRTTLSYPTRSGLLGMICAAMGKDRSDNGFLKELNVLKMTIYFFKVETRLIDYHTVGGGYDKKIDKGNIVPKATGKPGDTVQTYREYLQHSKFGVIFSGPAHLLDDICMALHNPKWGIWLGRKSCVPASPVCQGVFDTEESALEEIQKRSGSKPFRTVSEVDCFEGGTDTIMDCPVNFEKRKFLPRRIVVT